jgi:chromosome segregation ATPase
VANNGTGSRETLKKQLAEAAKKEIPSLAQALEEHEAKHQHLWDEQARINDEINALKDQLTEVAARIAAEDVPERTRLQNALAEAARDAGGKFLSDNA